MSVFKQPNKIKAHLVTIGNEILIGQITDTNSQWIAQKMSEIGIAVTQMKSIGDDSDAITATLDDFIAADGDVLIFTGGLGPTKDDLTKHVLAGYFNDDLVLDIATLNHIRQLFEQRGMRFGELNRQQAYLPASCRVLHNAYGTAAGMYFDHGKKLIFSLPGVPFEMKNLMTVAVIPLLKNHFDRPFFEHQTLMVQGIVESILAEKLADWEAGLARHQLGLAYLPRPGLVRLRISGWSDDLQELKKRIQVQIEALKSILGEAIIGYQDGETVVDRLQQYCKKHHKTLSVAESCTGGYMAHLLTEKAGASCFFRGGITAYEASVKKALLGVPREVIDKHTVVSEAVAVAMAKGVQQRMQTDYAIGIVGNAGPGKDNTDASVGEVCIAVRVDDKIITARQNFGAPRMTVIKRATSKAFQLLWEQL